MFKRGPKHIIQERAFHNWLAAGAAAVGAVSGALKGDSQQVQEGGYTLPPNFELDLIDQVSTNLRDIQSSQEQLAGAYETYNRRIDILQGAAKGETPQELAITQLRENTFQLANTLGTDANELASQGFLTSDEVEDFNTARQLAFGDGELQGSAGEAFERQKSELLQQLRRAGASPAAVEQSVRDLERSFKSQTSQNLLGLTEQRSLSRGRNLQGAQNTLQGLRGVGQDVQNEALNRLSGGINLQQAAAQLRGQTLGQFESLGAFDLSGQTKGAIKNNAIGNLTEGTSVTSGARPNIDTRTSGFSGDQRTRFDQTLAAAANLSVEEIEARRKQAAQSFDVKNGKALMEAYNIEIARRRKK